MLTCTNLEDTKDGFMNGVYQEVYQHKSHPTLNSMDAPFTNLLSRRNPPRNTAMQQRGRNNVWYPRKVIIQELDETDQTIIDALARPNGATELRQSSMESLRTFLLVDTAVADVSPTDIELLNHDTPVALDNCK
jgi:hypothetical protein